jgi:uncharacterized protein with PQ loop repeat
MKLFGMSIFGGLATMASLFIIIIGLPAQIIRNYRNKSTKGIAHSLIYAAAVTYTLWSIYAWTEPNIYLAVSQTPGAILSFVLLWQIIHYRE